MAFIPRQHILQQERAWHIGHFNTLHRRLTEQIVRKSEADGSRVGEIKSEVVKVWGPAERSLLV